jgi:hypothetical protein
MKFEGRCYDGPWHDWMYSSDRRYVQVTIPESLAVCKYASMAPPDTLMLYTGLYVWNGSMKLWIWYPPGKYPR